MSLTTAQARKDALEDLYTRYLFMHARLEQIGALTSTEQAAYWSSIGDLLAAEVPTYGDVIGSMRDYNRAQAPGSECGPWQDFVFDLGQHTARGLDIDHSLPAPPDFAAYWFDICKQDRK